MPHAFISHNSADKPQAIRLARALAARGVAVWLEVWELKPDQRWEPVLYRAIDEAAVVLVCIGEHGTGPWHDREVARAKQGDAQRLRLVRLPGWTQGDGGLGERQAYQLTDDEAGWDAGIAALTQPLVALCPAASVPPDLPPFHDGCPYPGVDQPFEALHAKWFFGREQDTCRVLGLALPMQPQREQVGDTDTTRVRSRARGWPRNERRALGLGAP